MAVQRGRTACPRPAAPETQEQDLNPGLLDFKPLSFPTSISMRSKEGSMFWNKPEAEMACFNSQTVSRLTRSSWERG